MKALTFTIALTAVTLSAFAAVKPLKPAPTIAERKAAKAAAELQRLKDDGGEVIRPGTMKGWILIADAQKLIDPFEIEEMRDYLWDTLNFNIKVQPSEKVTPQTAVAALKKSGAAAALFVVEDADLPALLVAPEDHWAIVNATKLAEGAKTPKYTEMRLKKEIVRGFVYLCGGASSSYDGSMMGALRSIEDLDRFAKIDLPMDVLMRFNNYMRRLGVTPAERTPYIFALDEPWCPEPANEWQQKVKNAWLAEKAAAEKAKAEKAKAATK